MDLSHGIKCEAKGPKVTLTFPVMISEGAPEIVAEIYEALSAQQGNHRVKLTQDRSSKLVKITFNRKVLKQVK